MTETSTNPTALMGPEYREAEAAFDAAQAALAATDTAELLRKAYALTHRLHVVERKSGHVNRSNTRDLRQQRDMIDAEILRRADRAHLAVAR